MPIVNIGAKVGTISAGYGVVNHVHKTPHAGIDYTVPTGTPIHAPFEGIISRIVDYGDKSLGKAVFVKIKGGEQYVIGHLSDIKVQVNQYVDQGSLLALSGSTGRSTAPHLHFGMFDVYGKPIDPGPMTFDSFTNAPALIPGAIHSIGDALSGFFGDKLGGFAAEKFDALITLLNTNSPGIITLAVILCGFGMMFGPMVGSTTGKWLGRTLAVLLIGVIWRALI